jgi:hypothetical protein
MTNKILSHRKDAKYAKVFKGKKTVSTPLFTMDTYLSVLRILLSYLFLFDKVFLCALCVSAVNLA